MKVLLINNIFYRKGGSEAVFFNTAELLKKHGHEVVFFSIKREENINCEQETYFPELGGKVNQLKSYFWNTEASRQLEKLIILEKPDIAHAHLFWGLISPSIFEVLRKYHVPLVHTVHDYRMVCPAYTFKNNLGEICEKCGGGHFMNCIKGRCGKGSILQSMLMTLEMYFRNLKHHPVDNINGFVFVSNFAKGKHLQYDKKFHKANVITLYNYTTPILEPIKEKKNYILYYGRLSYEKGIPTLIEAVAKYPELNLKVIGTGPIEADLNNRFTSPNIKFLGYLSGRELFELVRDAKFVCVPSEWYENNPMTIVEAYSLGTPVIGANIGGIPEIIVERKTGYLFESGNVSDLERAISLSITLTGEQYEAMAKAAYEFYKQNFSEEHHYEELIKFYQSVINDSQPHHQFSDVL